MKAIYSLFCILMLTCSGSSIGLEIDLEDVEQSPTDFKIRNLEVELKADQTVFLPPKIFQIWKALQHALDFEVGGGLDFNHFKELERIKLTPGKDQGVSFLPDFEIAWHTHPQKKVQGMLAEFNPPSPADLQLAIISNYNMWLLLPPKKKDPHEYLIRLRHFSEDLQRPLAVEMHIVADKTGVYLYRADQSYWGNIWKQGKSTTQKKIVELKEKLQAVVQAHAGRYVPNTDIHKLRQAYLGELAQVAHVELTFVPWAELLEKGLNIKLNLIELLVSERLH